MSIPTGVYFGLGGGVNPIVVPLGQKVEQASRQKIDDKVSSISEVISATASIVPGGDIISGAIDLCSGAYDSSQQKRGKILERAASVAQTVSTATGFIPGAEIVSGVAGLVGSSLIILSELLGKATDELEKLIADGGSEEKEAQILDDILELKNQVEELYKGIAGHKSIFQEPDQRLKTLIEQQERKITKFQTMKSDAETVKKCALVASGISGCLAGVIAATGVGGPAALVPTVVSAGSCAVKVGSEIVGQYADFKRKGLEGDRVFPEDRHLAILDAEAALHDIQSNIDKIKKLILTNPHKYNRSGSKEVEQSKHVETKGKTVTKDELSERCTGFGPRVHGRGDKKFLKKLKPENRVPVEGHGPKPQALSKADKKSSEMKTSVVPASDHSQERGAEFEGLKIMLGELKKEVNEVVEASKMQRIVSAG